MPEENTDSGWTSFASEYIRFMDEDDPNRTLLLDSVMLDECGNPHGQLVLDIGAGKGRFSRMRAARGARTIALDLTWPMVQAARHRAADGTAVVRSPATSLPIASSTIDLVVSYIVWVDVPDFRTAIAEAARVLKVSPEGRVQGPGTPGQLLAVVPGRLPDGPVTGPSLDQKPTIHAAGPTFAIGAPRPTPAGSPGATAKPPTRRATTCSPYLFSK